MFDNLRPYNYRVYHGLPRLLVGFVTVANKGSSGLNDNKASKI